MGSMPRQKIGRNSPCPCNSGKKYKNCCGGRADSRSVQVKKDVAVSIRSIYQLIQTGRLNNALVQCKYVLSIDPDNATVLELSSQILFKSGQYESAANNLERAISINPGQAVQYFQLGNIRKAQHRIDEAVANYTKSIEIDPNCPEVYINRANALGMQGMVEEAINDYKASLNLDPGIELARMNFLFMLNFSIKHNEKEIVTEHRHFGKYLEDNIPNTIIPLEHLNRNDGRLRIGYVSSDFYTHSVAYFILPVLENHNHDEFEIFAYYANTINDEFTQRLRKKCDCWHNVAALSDQSFVDLICKDKLDILVDLSGYTANSRIKVFAYKPAPIQITWIGYPNTTGLTRMDYRFTDAISDPYGSENMYTEKLYRLPDNFSVYQPPDECPDVTETPCLNSEVVTFGSFNNYSKTNISVIKLWARLLTEIPKSRLLLKNPALGDMTMKKKVLDAFKSYEIDSERLILLGGDREKKVHLQRYGQVDIGLDPFPYNGTTTTCEALWMGVPVVTFSGNNHRSRVGASLLTHIGHREWVAETEDEYVNIARELASNQGALNNIRTKLRNKMASSALMDARTFTLNLEKAYKNIWKKRT